jgi:hypothetical protein
MKEGGGDATKICIPAYQNSGTQGPMLSILIDKCNLQEDDQIKVRIKGGCKNVLGPRQLSEASTPSTAPQASPSVVSLTGSNDTLRNPYGNGSLQYVWVDLGELQNGRYDIEASFDGEIGKVAILNSDGYEYARSEALGFSYLQTQINHDC